MRLSFAERSKGSYFSLNTDEKTINVSELLLSLTLHKKVSISGIDESTKLFLLTKLIAKWVGGELFNFKRIIVVFSETSRLDSVRDALALNTSSTVLCPRSSHASSLWGVNRFSSYQKILFDRLRFLSFIVNQSSGIFFLHFPTLFYKTADFVFWRKSQITLSLGQEYSLDELIGQLLQLGYRQVERVEEGGEFASRGCVLDIFSPSHELGVRVEFVFDKIEEIRFFNVNSGLTKSKEKEAIIFPLWDSLLSKEVASATAQKLHELLLGQGIDPKERQSIVDELLLGKVDQSYLLYAPLFIHGPHCFPYQGFDGDDLLISWESLEKSIAGFRKFITFSRADWIEDRRQGRPGIDPHDFFSDLTTPIEHSFQKCSSLVLDNEIILEDKIFSLHSDLLPKEVLTSSRGGSSNRAIDFWIQYFNSESIRDKRIIIMAEQMEHLSRIALLLKSHKIGFLTSEESIATLLLKKGNSGLYLAKGAFRKPFWDEEIATLFLPEHILFDESFKEKRSHSDFRASEIVKKFRELKVGHLVVHSDHGIGRYCGMRTMEVGGFRTDFLNLEYAEKDRLYLPIYRMNLLQKYSNGKNESDVNIVLDKLRGTGWSKRKDQASRQAILVAEELTKLYALRKMSKRPAYFGQNDDYFQFEADFPYSETVDQQRAIDEVNSDLDRDFPMDRLVCGDVGFGKTEVALRAAMRVVQSGFQVIVLCPTSILSFQHQQTFTARFKRFGVETRLVNRFEKAASIKETLFEFQKGTVDILIGTHRLLSKDVVPKNLGLLVIDEEQKFGFNHKDFLKKMKANCDILALSATPIPRSLHMSLLGIRDISIISTPPLDRLSVRTYVALYRDDLVSSAIKTEINRGGQVFFVHNRIQDIEKIAFEVRQLVPSARIAIVHGQMKEAAVEDSLREFIEKKYDVLISTTIVESGIDIPNVNTIIVNNADVFGVGQLYQLRGRVGRSSRQAYAYFLTKNQLEENSDAKRRLDLMMKYQDVGSGFHVASYDLELRGAGNLLGGEQSGNIEGVGYEMYMDLLEREVERLKGKTSLPDIEPEININISASLSEDYIPTEGERLSLYKSLFSAKNIEEIYLIRSEVRDQYGKLPELSEAVFQFAALKVILKKLRASSIKMVAEKCELKFGSLSELQIARIYQVISANPEIYSLTNDFRVLISLREQGARNNFLNSLIAYITPFSLMDSPNAAGLS